MDGKKTLTKSANKMIGGVCAGIAEYFDLDPTLVRVAYLVLAVITAALPALVLYILLCIVMPAR